MKKNSQQAVARHLFRRQCNTAKICVCFVAVLLMDVRATLAQSPDTATRKKLETGLTELQAKVAQLEEKMYRHARDLEFEHAARIRDEIATLKAEFLQMPAHSSG